jgi:hypothetical protein
MIACATQSVTTSASVTLRLAFSGFSGREIVSHYANGCEQQVEVGAHRGLPWSAMPVSTADFDPAAQKTLSIHGLCRGINHLDRMEWPSRSGRPVQMVGGLRICVGSSIAWPSHVRRSPTVFRGSAGSRGGAGYAQVVGQAGDDV